ncbi:hypothetical protein KKC88_06410 [Patescibacteria group bacterium]|nr:hypothetical protein [Patescibacteria group bacterium]MBU1673885.1 hypothetical protein [Patescibacteria group bacterium]MBU1963442.1 hypothetical protein [Patescibacteria group bacterium]
MTIYFRDGRGEACPDAVIFLYCISRHLVGDQPGDRIDWKKTFAPIRRAWLKFWWEREKKNRQDR